jgi:hypothetical protein
MSYATSDPVVPVRPLAVLLCVLAGGCAIGFEAPEPFLVLDTPRREVKATTHDEASLWIREFEVEDDGNLEFWAEALHHDLLARGYRAVGEPETVEDRAGTPGRLRTYELHAAGRVQGYMVALFFEAGSGADTVRTAEFVAPKQRFLELLPGVRESLATIDP